MVIAKNDGGLRWLDLLRVVAVLCFVYFENSHSVELNYSSFQGMKIGNYRRSKYILDSPTYLVEIV